MAESVTDSGAEVTSGEPVRRRGALTPETVTGSGAAVIPGELVTPGGALTPETVTGSAVVVSLVGAGPGDPDLLTLRAEALLAMAAVVVVDAGLVGLAAAFAPLATIVPVPDRAPAVDAVLAAAAGGTHTPVVRLYGGDTWLHPAHGPESAALAAAGIPVDAVAGVATELALPALAGIAVHVRHLAVTCTIAAAGDAARPDDPARTCVVLTDDLQAAALALASVSASGDPGLPAAAVDSAAGRATRAPLGELAAVAPRTPGVLVIGAVAGVHAHLAATAVAR